MHDDRRQRSSSSTRFPGGRCALGLYPRSPTCILGDNFFFSSRRRHTRCGRDWSSDVCSSDLDVAASAHGIALGWEALGYLSGAAFGTAAMTLVGQNLGAGKPQSASHGGWVAFALGCAVMSFMGAVFYLLAEPMFRFFCPFESQRDVIVEG